jgi:hypothetical protein
VDRSDDEANEVEGDTYEHRVDRLLEHAVRDELAAQRDLVGLDLSDAALDNLAWAITARVHYAFEVRWSPDWTHGGPHIWSEADGTRARCGICLEDSPPQPDELAARRWHRDHMATHHVS